MVLGFTMGSEKLMPFIGLLMGVKLPLSNEDPARHYRIFQLDYFQILRYSRSSQGFDEGCVLHDAAVFIAV